MSVYVTDTHPLVWFTLGKRTNLSQKVLRVFEESEIGNEFIYVPAIVLWEVALLERTGKIKLDSGFLRWSERVFANPGFGITPLEPEIIALGAGYHINGDAFDETIAAFAAHLNLPLITKDYAITNSRLVEIYW